MSGWQLGQMIVCKDDIYTYRSLKGPRERTPVKGGIYSIRMMFDDGKEVSFLLNEIVNEPRVYDGIYMEMQFLESHFKAVRPTSIEQFEAILHGNTSIHIKDIEDDCA